METGSTPATIPALSAPAFLAHPTRFERVTVAFRASLVTPPQPLQGRCRRTANRLNEPPTHSMQHVVVPFLLGRQTPFLSMNKVPLALDWFFALIPSVLDTA